MNIDVEFERLWKSAWQEARILNAKEKQEMKFEEARELLKQGKNISRESWKEEDGYLALMKGMKFIWKILIKPTPNAGNHIFSMEELEATDWMEYNDLKFVQVDEKAVN